MIDFATSIVDDIGLLGAAFLIALESIVLPLPSEVVLLLTGFNVSGAATLITEDKNTFMSPSITAFYTKPFKASKRLTISPELYVISTPLIVKPPCIFTLPLNVCMSVNSSPN